MNNNRMSTADMLQYCDEALAWEDFGPIDIFFFKSVKRILLGQCSVTEDPDYSDDDLMGIERPVSDKELEPEYDKYADIYYEEDGDEEIPDYSMSDEDEAFSASQFSDGFFDSEADAEKADEAVGADGDGENKALAEESGEEKKEEASESNDDKPLSKESGSFTVNI